MLFYRVTLYLTSLQDVSTLKRATKTITHSASRKTATACLIVFQVQKISIGKKKLGPDIKQIYQKSIGFQIHTIVTHCSRLQNRDFNSYEMETLSANNRDGIYPWPFSPEFFTPRDAPCFWQRFPSKQKFFFPCPFLRFHLKRY